MMVAAAVELMLIAGHAVRKRDGAGQPALPQQFERAIDRGEADLRVFLAHQAEKLVSGKMVAGLQEGAQDSVTLVSVLQPDALQVPVKNVLGLTHGFARGRRMVVDPSLQHWFRARPEPGNRQMKMNF